MLCWLADDCNRQFEEISAILKLLTKEFQRWMNVQA